MLIERWHYTHTDVEGRRRLLKISYTRSDETFEFLRVQSFDSRACEWVTEAESPNLYEAREEVEEEFLRVYVPWLGTSLEKTRGPIESIDYGAGACLLLGTVGRQEPEYSNCSAEDDSSTWAIGRFGYYHQYGGHACCQASIQGAWFPLRTGSARLLDRLGPLRAMEDAGAPFIDPFGLLAIDTALERGLALEPLDEFEGIPSAEALHLFRLSHEAVSRIAASFRMVTRIRDVWPNPDRRSIFEVLETGAAPFAGRWDLARWMDVPAERLVGAFVYANSD